MEIKDFEILMWEAAKKKDPKSFLEVVCEDAVMICGGYRCSGAEYAQIIAEFDVAQYEISGFEIIVENAYFCQVHYTIATTVSNPENSDLEGRFHITSSWKRVGDTWKLIFNMDSRIIM